MMTHLAQRFGVDGYESIRELYAEAIRNQVVGFAEKAGLQLTRHELKDERALAAKMATLLQIRSQHSRLLTSSSSLSPRDLRPPDTFALLFRSATPWLGISTVSCRFSATAETS
jgi:hypothetical protein